MTAPRPTVQRSPKTTPRRLRPLMKRALFEVQIAAGAHVARVVDADVAVAEDEAAGGAEAGAQQRASAQPAADHPAQLQHVRRAPLVQRAGVAAAPVGDEAAERVDVGLHERPLASLVASCS